MSLRLDRLGRNQSLGKCSEWTKQGCFMPRVPRKKNIQLSEC